MIDPLPEADRPLAATLPAGGARQSGIWGLARLDGAPLPVSDLKALGLSAADPQACFLAAGFDLHSPTAVHSYRENAELTLLVGFVADKAGLAMRLGLKPGAPLAQIARAAFHAYGHDTPAQMLGEWSLLHCGRGGAITLMMAATRRDPLFYARKGDRLAIAPDLLSLGKLQWIGEEIDAAGLLMTMGRTRLREALGWRTMLESVAQLPPGGSLWLSGGRTTRRHCSQVYAQQEPWRHGLIAFEEEAETILRQALRDRLEAHDHATVLLSGGLDSSLLAWLTKEEGAVRQTDAITSIAPKGSGLLDELSFAQIVSEHLRMPLLGVVPLPQADPYRPAPHVLAGGNGPLLGNRHCLTDAFQQAARAQGASVLINGGYGEMNVTARLPITPGLRGIVGLLTSSLRSGLQAAWPEARHTHGSPCHVRLAPQLIAAMPEFPARPFITPSSMALCDSNLLGYLPGFAKAAAHGNAFHADALRMEFPYRDLRLLRLFAGLPLDLLAQAGGDRGIARQIMAGHLPDAIRLRRSGLPADPGHQQRLQNFASSARLRLPAFRRCGADEWLDLAWLDTALARTAQRGVRNLNEATMIQLTAMAGEFFCWWRGDDSHAAK